MAAKRAEAEKMNTPEGKLEERMRLQKIQERSNLVRLIDQYTFSRVL
jgi:hypothetical protein